MKFYFRFLFVFVITVKGIWIPCFGQLSGISADRKMVTAYSPKDTVFVFYQYPTAKKGALAVSNPFGTNANFSWSKYDTLSNNFGPVLKTDTNVLTSSLTDLAEGGYQVTITGTIRDTSFMAWVCFDDFTMVLEKDNAGNVRFGRYTCDYVDLNVKATAGAVFYYEDPVSHKQGSIKNTFTYTWSADPNPESGLPQGMASARVYPAPYKDTHYHVVVTDKFGLKKEDQVFYPSINPKARFTKVLDQTHVVNEKNSAPMTVTFTNTSENADEYIWYMGRNDTIFVKDPINIQPYTEPKTYYIRLVAIKNNLCVDSLRDSIQIAPPEIGEEDSIANVFTPNGDEKNDFFKVYNISIRQFRFTVYSRWGKKVYESPPVDMLLWEGWNGKINGNGPDASSGVYYYVLEVLTWASTPDPKLIHTNGKYSGFFYLFR